MKSFKSSRLLLARNMFFTGVFIFIILLVNCYFASVIFDVSPLENSTLSFILLLLISISLSVMIVLLFWNIKVEIRENHICFIKRGKTYKEYARHDFSFSSYVLRTRYLLIPLFTEKFLVVNAENKKPVRQKCHNFSGKEFGNMMAYLRSVEIKEMSKEELPMVGEDGVPSPSSVVEESFPVPREALLQAFSKRLKMILIPVGVILGAAVLYFVIVPLQRLSGNWGWLVFCSFLLPLVLGVFAILFFTNIRPFLKMKKTMPEKVEIKGEYLVFGSDVMTFSDIEKIKATPPTYQMASNASFQRRILVFFKDGRKKEYSFGFTALASKRTGLIYQEYASLCHTLMATLVLKEIEFVYELA